jgi:hypothetical protein
VLNPAKAISGALGALPGVACTRITGRLMFAGRSGAAVSFSRVACTLGKSGKQPITSMMRSERRSEGTWLIEFLRFVLNDVSVLRIIFFKSADLVARVGFWEYAELRTNALARRFFFLLGKPTVSSYVPARSGQLESISFVSAHAA